MLSIPALAEDFTLDWLNAALSPRLKGATVERCTALDSDVPGQTAEIILLELEYSDPDCSLPNRLVAKVTSRNPVVLEQIVANYDQYRRETSFYLEFPDCGIPIPDCLYAVHNPDNHGMVLLLADLSPATSPSWLITPEQVREALSQLPGFHAKWWNDELLQSKDWMVQADNRDFYRVAASAANAGGPVLSDLYEAPELTQEIMAMLSNKIDVVMAFFASRPFTFVHGDYHAKQMFFPSEQGGKFSVIDWQFPFVAAGAWDFARMLGMCASTDLRRAEETDLLAAYLLGLEDNGVTDYSMDELTIDYRMGLVISQMIMVIAAAGTDPAIFQNECDALGVDWRDVTFDRTQYALEAWDALGFLKSL